MSNRPETGAMEFGTDWPGVFIRGDNALYFSWELKRLLDNIEEKDIQVNKIFIQGLISLLNSSNFHADNPNIQKMKEFSECSK